MSLLVHLLNQAPTIIHHLAIHHQAVTNATIDHQLAATMIHETSVVTAIELAQNAIPRGIFTEAETEQFITLILAGTVTALMTEATNNMCKTLSSQMRNQLTAAAGGRLAKLQPERDKLEVQAIGLIKQHTSNAISTATKELNKLKSMDRSIEILRKFIDLLNADFSTQNTKAAVLAND